MTGAFLEFIERVRQNTVVCPSEAAELYASLGAKSASCGFGVSLACGITEYSILQQLVETAECKTVLEVGAGYGASGTFLLKGLEKTGGILTQVDMKEQAEAQAVMPTVENVRYFKTKSRDFFCAGEHDRPKFDMIFVDADHTEEPAKQDIEDSLHCLTSEGFVVAHDIIQPGSEHIEKICSDLAQAHGKQFVAYKQGNGLGIIF